MAYARDHPALQAERKIKSEAEGTAVASIRLTPNYESTVLSGNRLSAAQGDNVFNPIRR
jgi:hypothetical protein